MKQLAKKIMQDSRVDGYSDETCNGDGHWFYLKPGFINKDMEVHLIHEQTLTECNNQLRGIFPCTCNNCKLN